MHSCLAIGWLEPISVEMNGIENRGLHNIEKSFSGCLGRMVNLFDLSTGVVGNRLLMDKQHSDGSTLSRSRSDIARMLSLRVGDRIEDKLITPKLRTTPSTKRANGMPMKMLIAQEISKEMEVNDNTPNVVAKLMGLDAVPWQQPHSAALRSHSKGYSRSSSHSEIPFECWQLKDLEKRQCEFDQRPDRNGYKDVYETWKQSQQTKYFSDKAPQSGRSNENIEYKMALVSQKFKEAKFMATDEKLCQSKEFQDVLEVLSSEKDLFPKFLQEQNSLLTQHLYEVPSVPPPPETKRITVLRPYKVVRNENFAGSGKKSDIQIKKPGQVGQATGCDKNNPGYSTTFPNQKVDESPAQPTRIVVLKPSPGKTHGIKDMVSPPTSSPRILHAQEFYEEVEDNEAEESMKVAKKITQQIRENLMGHRRDKALLSSSFSNGYIGGESSFPKSENEFAVGNLCDSEVMSPTSRHSWEYINRFGSPYASSSFSRAACSPESSVCREAKRRLSERWTMMASNGSSQEQRHVRRNSSTLGEMLALPDAKMSRRSEEDGSGREHEPRVFTPCLCNKLSKEGVNGSPKNLPRSKSAPVSSTSMNVEVSVPEVGNRAVSKEPMKTNSMKSSFTGKVSSLFFSRNKTSHTGKSSASQNNTSGAPASPGYPPRILGKSSPCIDDRNLEECSSPGLRKSSSMTDHNLTVLGQKAGVVSWEADLSIAKPMVPRLGIENQEQPSPISVLESLFEEDYGKTLECFEFLKLDNQGSYLSNLIDKSPPIGSIARTLSREYSCAETATLFPLEPSFITSGVTEKQDWLLPLVQRLLSMAGLGGEVESDSFLARWYSPESPLDLKLREKYVNMNEEPMHESKRKQQQSIRKLVFDSVNAALMEIIGYGPCSGDHGRLLENSSATLVDRVWARMKEWDCIEVKGVRVDGEDMNRLVVRQELSVKGWVEHMGYEVDNIREEIEKKMLQDLVEEAVGDLTGGVL